MAASVKALRRWLVFVALLRLLSGAHRLPTRSRPPCRLHPSPGAVSAAAGGRHWL